MYFWGWSGREQKSELGESKNYVWFVGRSFVWFKKLKFDLKFVLKSTIRKRYFIDISYDYEYKVNGNK